MPRNVARPNFYVAAKLLNQSYPSLSAEYMAAAVGVSGSQIVRWRSLWSEGRDTEFSRNSHYETGKRIANRALRKLKRHHTEEHQVYLITRNIVGNLREFGKSRDTLNILGDLLVGHFEEGSIDLCYETVSQWLNGRRPKYFDPSLVDNTYVDYEIVSISTELTGRYWKRYCAHEYRNMGKSPAEIARILKTDDQWIKDATRPDRKQPLLQAYYDRGLIQRMTENPSSAEELADGASKSGPLQRWTNDVAEERLGRERRSSKTFKRFAARDMLRRYAERRAERLEIPMPPYLRDVIVERSMARASALA